MYNLDLYNTHLEVWIVQFEVYNSHFEVYNSHSKVFKLKNKTINVALLCFRTNTLPYVTVCQQFDRSMY